MPYVRAYLRASTDQQDANRAREPLQKFATENGLDIVSWYVENESGATLKRPELLRLIGEALDGDILLIEQVDRLSRLNADDWERLKLTLAQKRIKVVALDLPTSHLAMKMDESTQGILEAINRMLLDMLAVVARKDYTDRRRRQEQGIAKAKTAGLYKGRPVDTERHKIIGDLLAANMSWAQIVKTTGASRSTILRVKKAADEA